MIGTRRKRRGCLLFVAALVALAALASDAAANHKYSLSGSARFQIGSRLPIPAGFTAPPVGKVGAISGALVEQTTGPDPKQLMLPAGQLTAPAISVTIPMYLARPSLFQVQSALSVSFPRVPATLKANGRTGASTVSFCPGQVVLPGGNPMCLGPASGSPVPGRLRYQKVLNQFGGPAQAAINGSARDALVAASPPPCAGTAGCLAAFAQNTPPPTGPWGAPFGVANNVAHPAPSPGLYLVSATINGKIAKQTPTGMGPGVANTFVMYGGPWTTGRVTVSVTGYVKGGTQKFTLTGSDNRVSGVGSISLVSGAVSSRPAYGVEASRGWLNLVVGSAQVHPAVPAVSPFGIGAMALALVLMGVRATRRSAALRRR